MSLRKSDNEGEAILLSEEMRDLAGSFLVSASLRQILSGFGNILTFETLGAVLWTCGEPAKEILAYRPYLLVTIGRTPDP